MFGARKKRVEGRSRGPEAPARQTGAGGRGVQGTITITISPVSTG